MRPRIASCRYTYGKPVVGKATVRSPLPYYYAHPYPLPPLPSTVDGNGTTTTTTSTTPMPPRPTHVEKVVPIDGTATVEFDIKDDLK